MTKKNTFSVVGMIVVVLMANLSCNMQNSRNADGEDSYHSSKGYKLVWQDEFDYDGLPDPSKWNMLTGGHGWGNNEDQFYTARLDNASVENGILTIMAKQELFEGKEYTSARITTRGKFDFRYGRIEARIKLPFGQGIWPAFWMLGADIGEVGWPACGEIDVMEMIGGPGRDNTVHSTMHLEKDGEHAKNGSSTTLNAGIFADDFHIFSVEWDDQQIKGFMDNTPYFVADITADHFGEFHNNFYIILNLAVGGNWPGWPNASTSFPQSMKVDYVRVYQK